MNRRRFLRTSLAGAASLPMLGAALRRPAPTPATTPSNRAEGPPILSCYYLLAHAYTCVPRQIAEDFAWMRGVGVANVAVSILEQDPEHTPRNLDHLFNAAQRAGLGVIAVPSRWGGLVAGAPKVPSAFAASHFDTLVRTREGGYYTSPTFGPMCSVYHEATYGFMAGMLERVLQWPFAALTWDEIKAYERPDYSPSAQQALAPAPDRAAAHRTAVSDFFGRLNAHAKALRPELTTMAMLYANSGEATLSSAAQMAGLDCLGTDGRPWGVADGGTDEQAGKALLGGPGELTLTIARRYGKKSYCLIENHNLATEDYPLLERRLPEVLALGFDHILFYYYPRNLAHPERVMGIFETHLKAFRR